MTNQHDHRQPYEGDSGVLFEPEELEIEFVGEDSGTGIVPLSVDAILETAPGEIGPVARDEAPDPVELDELEFEFG